MLHHFADTRSGANVRWSIREAVCFIAWDELQLRRPQQWPHKLVKGSLHNNTASQLQG
jgi:hypothetical protein